MAVPVLLHNLPSPIARHMYVQCRRGNVRLELQNAGTVAMATRDDSHLGSVLMYSLTTGRCEVLTSVSRFQEADCKLAYNRCETRDKRPLDRDPELVSPLYYCEVFLILLFNFPLYYFIVVSGNFYFP